MSRIANWFTVPFQKSQPQRETGEGVEEVFFAGSSIIVQLSSSTRTCAVLYYEQAAAKRTYNIGLIIVTKRFRSKSSCRKGCHLLCRCCRCWRCCRHKDTKTQKGESGGSTLGTPKRVVYTSPKLRDTRIIFFLSFQLVGTIYRGALCMRCATQLQGFLSYFVLSTWS